MPVSDGKRHLDGSAATCSPLLLGLMVFGATGLALVVLSWHIIAATGTEGGDFAANSILIQFAKHLKLTLGNYSRVGFNHPGPAILYVLAGGEFVFHDRWKFVTPIGGQLIAADLYNAAWLGLCAGLLARMGTGAARTVTVVAIAAAVLALRDPHSFDNLWFPYLYVLPFLAFLVALAAVSFGDRLAWIGLAVSTGFLVNGHVSFVGVCGIAIAIICVDLVARRKMPAPMWPLSAALVFALFLVPLAIREVRHRPGPIEEYARFAGTNPSHGLLETLHYIGRHVASTGLELVVVALAVLCIVVRAREPYHRAVLSAAVAVSAGTFYYVMKGIDDLQYDYVILYYYAAPALILAVAAFELLSTLGGKGSVLTTIGGAAAIWAAMIAWDSGMPDYDRPGVAELDQDMQSLGSGKIWLSSADPPHYGDFWGQLVGVEAKRLRERKPLGFCIGEGWNVAFGELARCGSADEADIRMTVFGADTVVGSTPALTSGSLSFYRPEVKCLAAGDSLVASRDRMAMTTAMVSGWSSVEGEFGWSLNKDSKLSLCIDLNATEVVITLGAFLANEASVQRTTITGPGIRPIETVFDTNSPKRTIIIPLEEQHPRDIEISLLTPDAVSPAQAGVSSDARVLGVALHSVEVH